MEKADISSEQEENPLKIHDCSVSTEILELKTNYDENIMTSEKDIAKIRKKKKVRQPKQKKKDKYSLINPSPQGDSVLSFNPYKKPEFTEKYTLLALQELNIDPIQLQYPSNEEISKISSRKRLIRITREKEYQKRDQLIELVKSKREEIIRSENVTIKLDNADEDSKSILVQGNIDSSYTEIAAAPIIVTINTDDGSETLQNEFSNDQNDIDNLLFDDISKNDNASIVDDFLRQKLKEREKRREERLQKILDEKNKKEEEVRKSALERIKKESEQIEQSRKERNNNAYIVGVAREIKLLSARENLKEIVQSRVQKVHALEEDLHAKEAAAIQRAQNERKKEEEKMAKKLQQAEEQRKIALSNQQEFQQKLQKVMEEKEQCLKQRLVEVTNQKKLEAQEHKMKIMQRAERAAALRKQRREEKMMKLQEKIRNDEERVRKSDHERIEKQMSGVFRRYST
ncbi:hypothetical protein TVAG_255100 [Trichomonas vaginalis G3]|uniref:Uncharacterized protein n=1 Tax=Trichomonas vaginalis (strain ATCC PRA-98 / G3) TaxID=412133 RepID=A2FPX0_TRIV3|nr:hypothetical protein TVAGG3_0089050 [Trichomonas vaginalis G3]EAX93029.1 hypothetical protein TVAG_255100 [Trichomonas vaginalis G3]KAI5543775.1 hypothetical protein TVAGG3_0089050 [Trichomonas vaginalis G3]|eukprot:XP_001305959.1 hypothetical protein [Trichomonas vaginalis G3]